MMKKLQLAVILFGGAFFCIAGVQGVRAQEVSQEISQEVSQEVSQEMSQQISQQVSQEVSRQMEQQKSRESGSNKGSLSGSFETNSIYYVDDKKAGSTREDDTFGSNNYLKLDYTNRKFTVGVQMEGYYPTLVGYPPQLKGTKITNKFVTFTDKKFQITAGDFYDQFGNGLIFRAYEDRALGYNNSIEGVRASFNTKGFMIKAIYGRQRQYMDYVNGHVRGLDASLSFSQLFNMGIDVLDIEGSMVSKYQKDNGGSGIPSTVTAYSGRLNIAHGGFVFRGEYVEKGPDRITASSSSSQTANVKGNALLLDIGYSGQGFGIQLIGRRLENMSFRSDRDVNKTMSSDINYLPSLTLQSNYALGAINPYSTYVNQEIGGQLDVYYNIPSGTALGGKYGTKIQLNGSTYYTLKKGANNQFKFFQIGNELLWEELNLSVSHTFNKKFKMLLLGGHQRYNTMVLDKGNKLYTQIFVVADATYKFNRRHALRMELQHLWSKEYKGNWAYATLEYTIAPKWSIYASDMYNYGAAVGEVSDNRHYYNVGMSFAHSRTRFALSYGRNREGMTCSGGVCRFMPAYTGVNFVLTSSF